MMKMRMLVSGAVFYRRVKFFIRERGTHLDSLMERMKEPRVRRVVEPVMIGEMTDFDALQDDVKLVLDMGILVMDGKVLKPANPMYSEVI